MSISLFFYSILCNILSYIKFAILLHNAPYYLIIYLYCYKKTQIKNYIHSGLFNSNHFTLSININDTHTTIFLFNIFFNFKLLKHTYLIFGAN